MRAEGSAYPVLVRLADRLPGWLRRRIDPFNQAADAFVRELAAELPAKSRVVDAGAGECRFADDFSDHLYLGTDNGVGDAAAWDYSRLAFQSDLRALPLADDSVDAVICRNVIEHVREPVAVLAELCRVLRPGGRLQLVAPQSWWLHQAPHDYLRFTRYGLEMLLEQAGLEPRRVEPIGGAFWNLGTRSLHVLTFFGGAWFPLALLLAPFFGFALPLLCYYLDRLDHRRNDTLGHRAVALKPRNP